MKIVLAYSGGLDTSVLLSWIKEKYNAEMIAFCANIGQEEELKGLDRKAKKTGASKIYIDDLEEEFASDFIYPMIHAGAIYENQYFLGTSIARPLIAKRMVEIAHSEGAEYIAHGATGKGNDQVRFELTAAALAPDLKIIAPWRDASFRDEFPGRAEMIKYCEEKNIPVQATAKKPYSMDRNLLHISFEAGILEDPWLDASAPAHKEMYKLSVSPEDAPDKSEYVTLDFEKGNCVAVNGRKLSPLGVMKLLNKLGGKHGVGRVDLVENRYVGMKSRGVYETPGGAILHFAHRQMESITMDREVMHLRLTHPPLFRAGLLRLLVFARTLRVASAGDGKPAECHRFSSGEAVQGKYYYSRTKVTGEPLQSAHRDNGSGSDESVQPG
jgi:argininosuccinate synthase